MFRLQQIDPNQHIHVAKLLFAALLVILATFTILPKVHCDTLIQIASKQKLCFQENIKEGTPMRMRIKVHSHPSKSMLRVVGKDLSNGGDKLFDLFYDLDTIERKNIAHEKEEDMEMVKQIEYSFTTGMISYYDGEEEVSTYQICLYNKEGVGSIELSFALDKLNQYEELESVTHIKSKLVTIFEFC